MPCSDLRASARVIGRLLIDEFLQDEMTGSEATGTATLIFTLYEVREDLRGRTR
jgi:hypothetical protein